MTFFDEKTCDLIWSQIRILQNAFAIFCIFESEFLLIMSTQHPPQVEVGWNTMQNLALGIAILILDITRAFLIPGPNNEKD